MLVFSVSKFERISPSKQKPKPTRLFNLFRLEINSIIWNILAVYPNFDLSLNNHRLFIYVYKLHLSLSLIVCSICFYSPTFFHN